MWLGGIVQIDKQTTPQPKIIDFCQLPLHRGAFRLQITASAVAGTQIEEILIDSA
jgi:hypothetical protein